MIFFLPFRGFARPAILSAIRRRKGKHRALLEIPAQRSPERSRFQLQHHFPFVKYQHRLGRHGFLRGRGAGRTEQAGQESGRRAPEPYGIASF